MPGIPFDMLQSLNHSSLTLHEYKVAVALLRLIFGPGKTEARLSLNAIGRFAGMASGHVHTAIHGKTDRAGLVAKAILLPPAGTRLPIFRFNPNVLDWPLSDAYREHQAKFLQLQAAIDPVAGCIKTDPRLVYDRIQTAAGRDPAWLMAMIVDSATREKPSRWLLSVLMRGKYEPTAPAYEAAKELLGYTRPKIRRFGGEQ